MVDALIQHAYQSAARSFHAGRLAEAQVLCRQILVEHPDDGDTLHLMGLASLRRGQLREALEFIGRAISVFKDRMNAQSRAADAGADLAEAQSNFGIVLTLQGRHEEAILAHRSSLALRPKSAETHNNLGHALQMVQNYPAAIAAFREAVALRPDYPAAYNNLGNALRYCRQYDEAIAAFRQAILLRSDYAEAHHHLGIALVGAHRREEAVKAFRDALALNPRLLGAYNNLGNALQELGRLDEALACFDRALALQPSHSAVHSNRIFAIHFHPNFDPTAILHEAKEWNRRHGEPLKNEILFATNDRNPHRKLRIGYVSPDFRNHSQAFFTIPLFSHHDRSQFEIFCYADVPRPDEVTESIQSLADVWKNTAALNDAQIAEMIRADQIDILVDLTMHMSDGRLLVFARKPAPIQVTWLAYPGTTGLNAIDYRLSDPYLDPDVSSDSDYSEQTVRLPNSFWCYDPLTSGPGINSLPAISNGYITFGCLNNFCKVTEPTLRLWSNVLAAVPNSRLLLLCPPGEHQDKLRERLGRVDFVPFQKRPEYLQTYHRIDIGLDTFPYNGHTTSLDSFWMGVPVVSLVGRTVVSRAGFSQASNLDLADELIAQDEDQFVERAWQLAGDFDRLAKLRAGLRKRMEQSPLMDGEKFARDMESIFRNLWEKWCQTRP